MANKELLIYNHYINNIYEEIISYENKYGNILYRWKIPLIHDGVRDGRAILEEFFPAYHIVAIVHFENNLPRFRTYYGSYTNIEDEESLKFLKMK